MSKPRIIGIMGKAGSGKSLIAKYLHGKFDYERSKFSKILKDMLLCIPGITEDMIEGHLKEVPNMILGGHTPRKAMQTLGTEWGRNMICETFWVDSWARHVAMKDCKQFVSVEDVRFPNELEAVHDLGGVIWNITRSQAEDIVTSNHQSELMMAGMKPDLTVANSGNLDDLMTTIDNLMLEEYGVKNRRNAQID